MAVDPITSISSLATEAIDKIWPDAGEADRKKLEAVVTLLQLQTSNLVSEANSDSWITKSWRPITMITFAALIAARWLGLSTPGLSEAEYLKLWDIVQLGLGAGTIGRTVEKIIPELLNRKT